MTRDFITLFSWQPLRSTCTSQSEHFVKMVTPCDNVAIGWWHDIGDSARSQSINNKSINNKSINNKSITRHRQQITRISRDLKLIGGAKVSWLNRKVDSYKILLFASKKDTEYCKVATMLNCTHCAVIQTLSAIYSCCITLLFVVSYKETSPKIVWVLGSLFSQLLQIVHFCLATLSCGGSMFDLKLHKNQPSDSLTYWLFFAVFHSF